MHPEKARLALPTSQSVAAFLFSLGLLLAVAGFVLRASAQTASLPAPWRHQDIGVAEVPGTATHANGVFTLKGTQDIWGTNDGFHFTFQGLIGDGEIVARVTGVENTLNHAKGGLMFREALTPGAISVCEAVTPVDGAQFLFRPGTDGPTKVAKLAINKGTFPYWIKLTRKGDTFSGYESLDGKTWQLTGSTNVAMSAKAFVGLTSSSHVKNVLCASTFDNVVLK